MLTLEYLSKKEEGNFPWLNDFTEGLTPLLNCFGNNDTKYLEFTDTCWLNLIKSRLAVPVNVLKFLIEERQKGYGN